VIGFDVGKKFSSAFTVCPDRSTGYAIAANDNGIAPFALTG
jgi:hypothetical protein